METVIKLILVDKIIQIGDVMFEQIVDNQYEISYYNQYQKEYTLLCTVDFEGVLNYMRSISTDTN